MKLIAVHEIEYCENKKRKSAPPGHMFEIDDETGERLKKMGAARDPSEAELALEALKASKQKAVKSKAKVETDSEEQPKRRGRRRRDEGGDSGNDDDVV